MSVVLSHWECNFVYDSTHPYPASHCDGGPRVQDITAVFSWVLHTPSLPLHTAQNPIIRPSCCCVPNCMGSGRKQSDGSHLVHVSNYSSFYRSYRQTHRDLGEMMPETMRNQKREIKNSKDVHNYDHFLWANWSSTHHVLDLKQKYHKSKLSSQITEEKHWTWECLSYFPRPHCLINGRAIWI